MELPPGEMLGKMLHTDETRFWDVGDSEWSTFRINEK